MNYYPEYFQPVNLTDLARLPSEKKIYFLAGGTDLFCYLRDGLIETENSIFVDVARLQELSGIAEEENHLRIGAGVTFAEISTNSLIKKWAPVLAIAANTIGTPQIRNRATIGGNIANASPAGDSLPALAVQEAELELNKFGQKRIVKLLDIFIGPKKTNLANGELITAVRIPKKNGWKGNFQKIGGRRSHIISKASIAVYLRTENSVIKDINIALGAVAPTVVLATSAARVLIDQPINQNTIQKAIAALAEVARPVDDFRSSAAYRQRVLGALFRQVLSSLVTF